MTKKILATALAATLAITSLSTTPVRAADSGEIGRFLLGAGTLFIIGSAISNNNRNHGTTVTRHNHGSNGHNGYTQPRPRYKKFVPAACVRNNKWNNGPRRFLGQVCLHRKGFNVSRLPGNCLRGLHSKKGYSQVFSARCLRKHGWKFG